MQKKLSLSLKFFAPSPSDLKKNQPFLPRKLRINPIEKHVKSILENLRYFFQASPYKGKTNFKVPLLVSWYQALPNKCLWTVPKIG